jgi:hypothetical protein
MRRVFARRLVHRGAIAIGHGAAVFGVAAVAVAALAGALRVPALFGAPGEAAALPVVINEVLYDPAGKDEGAEFVELFNRSDSAVRLAGWRLESGNGSSENRWTLEWTGGSGDTVGPWGFFVVGEALVSTADFVTELDLQNGPDACRLVCPDGQSDVVGWGDHTFAEYYEGGPVACPASGASVGRDPDGTDTDRNFADFAAFDRPSPRGYNHPPCDLALLTAGLSRYTPSSGASIDLVSTVANLGTAPCGAEARVAVSVGPASGASTMTDEISPGGQARIVVRVASPGPGLHRVWAWVDCAADPLHDDDTLATTVVLPPPPLVVNEVMFKPAGSDCEWIELANPSGADLNLRGWTLEDSGARPKVITDSELEVAPDGFVVLVEDESAFRAAYGESSGVVCLRPQGGWPTLNDVDGTAGFADAVVVRDEFGTAVDSMAYRAAWSKPGVSIERIDPRMPSPDPSNWSPHYGGPGGSPGSHNSVSFFLPRGGRILNLSPSTFSPDGDGRDDLLAVSVRFSGRAAVTLAAYDVNGRRVRRLLDGDVIDAARITFWDGKDDDGVSVPIGVYIIAAEASVVGSDRASRAKAAAILIRR